MNPIDFDLAATHQRDADTLALDTKGGRQKLKNGRQTQTRKEKVRYRFRAWIDASERRLR